MTSAATARALHATSSRTSYIKAAATAAAHATDPFSTLRPPTPTSGHNNRSRCTTTTTTSSVSVSSCRLLSSSGRRVHKVVNNINNNRTTNNNNSCRSHGTTMPSASSSTLSGTAGHTAADDVNQPVSELWSDVVRVYDRAQASGACSKTDTQVELFHDTALNVSFVLRLATALNNKPSGPPLPPPATSVGVNGGGGAVVPSLHPAATASPAAPAPSPAPWRNPFLPPEPDLFARHLGPHHSLVLNKFNVVAHHVLVIAREFRSQAEPLYGSDLAATMEVLKAMPHGGVAFYNCGPHSGRSQPHKHLQVVPLPFTNGQPPLAPVQTLVDAAVAAASPHDVTPLQPLAVRQVPYRCYVALLPDSPSPEQLEAAFSALLQQCFPGYQYTPPPGLDLGTPPRDAATAAAFASGSVSYNVLLTRHWLMLVPRSAERCGPLALNSLSYAGTMLVRSQEELEYVRQTTLSVILASIGEPWSRVNVGEGSKM